MDILVPSELIRQIRVVHESKQRTIQVAIQEGVVDVD